MNKQKNLNKHKAFYEIQIKSKQQLAVIAENTNLIVTNRSLSGTG